MAAHPYTMLKQMSESLNGDNPLRECELIAHAMMYCQQADYILEGLDIYDLACNKYPETLKRFIDQALLPKYEAIWLVLGSPRTWEDWYTKLLHLRTTAKGKYSRIYRQHSYTSIWDYMTQDEKDTFRIPGAV